MNQLNNSNQEVQEDEIDLRELWETIKKGKKNIFIISSVIVFITLLIVLRMPNIYKSEMVLIPSQSSSSSSFGGLGGLAAMAGVSLGGGSMTPDVAFSSLLGNYQFMHDFVLKNKVLEHYEDVNVDKNYVFALGFRGLYDLTHTKKSDVTEKQDKELRIFNLVKQLSDKFRISSDKKTSLVTISFSDNDRLFAPLMVNAFLSDATKYLVENNLKNINSSLKYYEVELAKADSIEIRQSLSSTISKILEQKVVMQSKKYYQCDPLTTPSIAYEKDKVKPKRGFIVVVSFIVSIVLGIFFVFFINFIRGNKEVTVVEKSEENSNSLL